MKERYHVSGMTCSACSAHVEKAVNRLAGVEKASVNLLTESMEVSYDEKSLGREEIIAAVEKAGYGADVFQGQKREGEADPENRGTVIEKSPVTVSDRDGLARKAKEEARAMKWRLGISVGFLVPLMYVAMYHMVHQGLGIPMPAFVHRYLHGNENAMTFAMTQLLLVLPILYMNRKFFAVGFKTLAHRSPNMDSLIALGASASLGYGIFAMYRISFGLGHGDLALVERYAHDLYFESAGMILTLITVGKYLESRSKGKTSEAITKLMNLSPKTAILLMEDGREQEVLTENLRAGDIFLVKPGSLVPVDGTVLEGNSSVDEAAITGESVPVEKQAGDKVVSATVNKAGFLKCRADRVGEDTTLSQIIRLVEEASASKAPIAQLADKVAGVFVPVVIAISLVTLLVWLLAGAGAEFAISSAIAVLVISCPCALGLATPVAIMVGTGVGAGHGILIKSGEALQQARDIDTVVMDKTGTITAGRLKVMEVSVCVQDMALDTFLQIAAALEKKSEHPLAESILEHAKEAGLPIPSVRDFQAVFGRGVEGVLAEDIPPSPFVPDSADGPSAVAVRAASGEKAAWAGAGQSESGIDGARRDHGQGGQRNPEGNIGNGHVRRLDQGARMGTRYLVGNRAYMAENHIDIDPVVEQGFDRMADEGMTPLLVAQENRFLGVIGVADEIKASSREAIRSFGKMGIRVVMLTGDNRRTAEAVRTRLHIPEVVAEVLPQDKEKKISALKAQGHKVAMIGDGINDAPALAAADVGMAIGAGTDVAMESADIVLMKSDLRDAVTAVRLSRAVIRNIKENLFWAFFYNCIGIPLAAGLWYPLFQIRLNPMFGAAAMSLSSIFVVGNALRLRRFRSGFQEKAEQGQVEMQKEGQQSQEGQQGQVEMQKEGQQCQVEQKNQEEQQSQEGQQYQVKQQDLDRKLVENANTVTMQNTPEQSGEIERSNTMTKTMTIEGMMCTHCTGRVQKALEALEGVAAVTMSLEEKSATVELAQEVSDEVLTGAVTEAGYEVKGIV